MIRLTEAQYRNLATGKPPSNAIIKRPQILKTMKSRVKSRLKEADVTKQCVQLMEAHGWKAIRLQRGLMRRRDGSVAMTIGKKGMCDWLFLRTHPVNGDSWQWPGQCLAWMCEFKAPGKKPSDAQMDFMSRCRAVGFVAEWFDSYDIFATFVWMTFGIK